MSSGKPSSKSPEKGNNNEGQFVTPVIQTTTDGHVYWTPNLPDDLKPREKMVFRTLEDGEKFYEMYARLAGFESRKSTLKKGAKGEARMRLVVCNKEGVPESSKHNNLDGKKRKQRLVPSGKTDCRAQIRFRLTKGWTYEVYRFEEQHNHYLMPPEDPHKKQQKSEKTSKEEANIRDMYADLAYCVQVLRGDGEGMENARKRHHDLIMELTAGREKNLVSKNDVVEQVVDENH